MKLLLTGGSGNLGQALVPNLLDRDHTPVILDVRAPPRLNAGAVFIERSVLNPPNPQMDRGNAESSVGQPSEPSTPHCVWRAQIPDLLAGRLIHPMS